MARKIRIPIRPGSDIIGQYKETQYKIESVFAEYVDNSTQSFFDHREELKQIGISTCRMDIEIYPEVIRISDNAFGMNENNFDRAFLLNARPDVVTGRNERGMGLKTASTSLGKVWTVKTTEYGNPELYIASMNVTDVEKNSPEEIAGDAYDIDPKEHFTVVEIHNLIQKITPAKVKNIIESLAEMYSRDIKNGDLTITINKEPLKYELPEIRKDADGNEYLKTIQNQIEYDGVTYSFSGWAGIRKTGGTLSSGLTLLHKGRAVITNYRPKGLLGGPNTYPYQRIIGEIDMGDEWPIAHTKDAFVWEGGLEDKFIESLKAKTENGIGELIAITKKLRKDDSDSEEQKRAIKGAESKFKGLKDAQVNNTSIKNEPVSHEEYVPEQTSKPSDKTVHVDFQGIGYDFEIIEIASIEKEWISIERTGKDNYYLVKVDYDMPYFHSVFSVSTKSTNYEFLEKLVVSIALAFVTSKSSGCKDGYMLINMLNNIIRNTE